MGFRFMALSQLTLWVGPRGIEVAQTHGFKAIGGVVILKQLLDHPFAAPIWIDGQAGMILGQRICRGNAVDRCCRRKNEMPNSMPQQGIHELFGQNEVVVVVGRRITDGFPNLDERGEMHDRIKSFAG
jgi:hypothetical protein